MKRGGAICLRQWQDLSTISNCVFAGNTAKYGGAVGNYFSTRTDDVSWGGLFFDCVFTNNASFSHGGAAFNAGLMRKCKFIGNHLLANFNSSYGAAVYQAHLLDGCDFVENGSTEQRYGAVYNYGTYETTNLTIRNCKFIRNIAYTGGAAIGSGSLGDGCCNTIVKGCLFESNSLAYDWANGGAVSLMTNIWDCTFVGNSSCRGGAAYQSTLYGCTFISNRSIRTDVAGALRECKAYNCTFTGNFAYQGAAAYMSSLVGCVISNNDTVAHNQTGRVLEHCMVDSCRIQDETSDGVIFAGRCYVTNTLVTGCEGNGYTFLVGHNASCTQTLVNCTIVSNNFTRFVNWYNNTGDVHVVNSLFFGNTVGGNAYDFDSSATNCLKSITNSVFAVSSASCLPDGALDAGAGNYNYAGTAFNPKFAGERVDPKNPFALRRGSPCVKTYHGLVQDWMAAATDIRGDGFPRLRDGRVDIGCYQCWEVVPGLVITVR